MSTSGQDDFSFIHGTWQVAHRRLQKRLVQCKDCDEFDGVARFQPLLGGQGNVDDNLLNLPAGPYRAATLRAYDPTTGQWAIWWLDARSPHSLDTPMKGRFTGPEGVFLADDLFEGKAIKVRFLWSKADPVKPVWEQAFSPDGGETWETNWTMTFTRADPTVVSAALGC